MPIASLDEVDHAGPAPRLRQVDLVVADRHDRRAGRVDGGLGDQALGDVDHLRVVGERLVELHHRELGVVARGDALVAEDPTDLEHSLHAADDQPLEVQLERDAQVQLHVEGVVVGDERPGVGAAGLEVQHRCLDLDEAFGLQRATEAGDDLVTDPERPARLFVDDEIGVALAKPRVGVGEPVPLVGHRPDRLRQQLDAIDLDAELALAGGHHGALCTQPITEIELAEGGETLVADHALRDEQLHLAAAIDQGGEDQLALLAAQHHPAGDGDSLVGLGARPERTVGRAQLFERVRAIEAVRIRVGAGVAQGPDLVEPLGLLGRQPAADGVSLDVGLLVTHRGKTVSLRRC